MSGKICCCKSGEYMCEVPVLYPLGQNRLVSVDRCMVPELQSLWMRGIETGGCYCGHFENDGFIQVMPEHENAMVELGYEKIPPYEVDGQLYGECAFKPKTHLEFHGYGDFKTVLEQRYEKLEQVALSLHRSVYSLIECIGDITNIDDIAQRASVALEAVTDAGHVYRDAYEKLCECGVSVYD